MQKHKVGTGRSKETQPKMPSGKAGRNGDGEVPTSGGFLGIVLQGWWDKEAVGFGEQPHTLTQTELRPS